ncbi:hypothetical protein BH09ACT10_BH09ACT10_07260 [soil metagenome]
MGGLSLTTKGFPAASIANNSSTFSTPVAAFLSASTPFGAAYGSSQTNTYLNTSTAASAAPSTTTYTFESATPATGWGIAFADIDADSLKIVATGPGGTLTASQLGFQGTFNFWTAATPRPSACGGVQTDVPTWDPTTSTLIGNVADTTGATGWFQPTAAITSITLTFTRLSATGSPIFQTWVASDNTLVSGTVELPLGDPAPEGTPLSLQD